MTTKVHQLLARALAEQGQGPLFGVVGDANAWMIDAFMREHGGRYVAAAHEAGAVLMALGAAAVTGGTGFATVTHGPALTNCVTPLVEGVRSYTPLVLLAGDTKPGDRENLQKIDQRAVILSTGAGFEPVHGADTALDDLARAVRRARAERRPVVLNMPADILWQTAAWRRVPWDVPALPGGRIEGDALDQAVGLIAAARRPVVLAGRGAIGAADRAALVRLARRIEAPLATTLRARGLFAGEDHALGVMGTVSTPQALDALGSADLILAFGAGLNFHTTAQGGLMRGRRVVQVADRACDLGQGHVADVAILARPQDAADTLVQWLDAAEIPPSGFTRDLPAKGLDRPAPASARTTRAGTVDFLTTLERLESILPAPRTLVTDAGRWMVRSYGILTAPGPLDHVTTASFGSIGLGMGAAIGAAVARPDRPCVLACGDGGFMLGNLTELHSAVRAGLDLIVVIFNDGAYGAEHIQFRDRQRDPALTLFDWPDFVPLARALGAGGAELRSPADLEALPARLEERDRSRPFVIDVRLDPDQVAMW